MIEAIKVIEVIIIVVIVFGFACGVLELARMSDELDKLRKETL